MPFIKHGDGKIVSVIESDELTDNQKNTVKEIASQQIKESDDKSYKNKNVLGDN